MTQPLDTRSTFAKTLANPRNPREGNRGIARSPITAWGLLVWAYRQEMVRATCGDDGGARLAEISTTGRAMAALAMGGRFMGTIDPWAQGAAHHVAPGCHDDALVVHAWTRLLGSWQLQVAAEAGAMPDWNPQVPEVDRMVPVRDGWGEPVIRSVLHPVTRRRVCEVCLVRPVPENARSEAERERIRRAARDDYARMAAELAGIAAALSAPDCGLTLWRVTGLGIDPAPWQHGGLTGATKT